MPVWGLLSSIGLLLVLGAVSVAGLSQQPVVDASREMRPAPTFTVKPAPAVTDERPVVAFLGDSYTVGARATEAERWSSRVSAELGWAERNFGIADTGYFVVGAMANGNLYRDRIAAIAAENPATVIVSGGRNDLWNDQDDIDAAIRQTFQELRAALPNAQIIAVNPWWDSTEPPRQLADIGTTVQASVEEVGGRYLDAGQPLVGHPEWIHEDLVHPIAPGYAALAEAFLAAYGG